MVVLLWGQEDFLIEEKKGEIIRQFQVKYPQGEVTLLGEEAESGDINRLVNQGSGLFSLKRLIIADGCLDRVIQQVKKTEQFLKKCLKGQSEIVLVFVYKKKALPKGKIIGLLKREAKLIQCSPLVGRKLQSWIERKISKQSQQRLKITTEAAEELAVTARENLWKISGEIEKLVNYKEKGIITKADIESICGGKREMKIFDLVDAIGQRNRAQALALLLSLLRQGENEFYLLTMITYQIKNLARVRNLWEKGVRQEQAISQKLKIHPFVAKKTLIQLKNFSTKDIKRLYHLAARLDAQAKQGEVEAREGLVDLVAGA